MVGVTPDAPTISSRTVSEGAQPPRDAGVGDLGRLEQHLHVDAVHAVGAGDDRVEVEEGELGDVGRELPRGDDQGLEGVDVDPLVAVHAVEQRPRPQAAESPGGVTFCRRVRKASRRALLYPAQPQT